MIMKKINLVCNPYDIYVYHLYERMNDEMEFFKARIKMGGNDGIHKIKN